MPASNAFQAANRRCRRADHARWHRLQSKRHILRSQLGFGKPTPSRPQACVGCAHYHGLAYGHSRLRTVLVCGFHPYGWDEPPCPDWAAAS
ncbi:MAG: hypothetical protein AAF289_12895 [Cyanobacteria bacterium P01_A01_bin.135]